MILLFKDVLKQLRTEKGLTQEELADALGIKAGAIGNYEQGQRLPKDDKMWIKIANYFNVTVDYLMDVPDSPHIIAANTGSTDGTPVLVLSKPEDIIRNPKKDKLIKLIQEGDIPDDTLDGVILMLQQYKK